MLFRSLLAFTLLVSGLHAVVGTSFAPMGGTVLPKVGSQQFDIDHREQSPRIQRRQSEIPLDDKPVKRTKSFGEMSAAEYQEIVEQLWLASEKGDERKIAECVQQGAWINHIRTTSKVHMAPLHIAAYRGHQGAVRKLVELGADVNVANRNGFTPLHMAAHYGNLNVVKKLVMLGADIGQKCRLGDTASDKANMVGNEQVVAYLKSVEEEDRHSLHNINHRWRHISRPTACLSRIIGK